MLLKLIDRVHVCDLENNITFTIDIPEFFFIFRFTEYEFESWGRREENK